MKKLVLFLLLSIGVLTASAQGTTTMVTVYQAFKPATIHLVDGRQLKVSLANIFLKNSSLLYISGHDTKEASLQNISTVEFQDQRPRSTR